MGDSRQVGVVPPEIPEDETTDEVLGTRDREVEVGRQRMRLLQARMGRDVELAEVYSNEDRLGRIREARRARARARRAAALGAADRIVQLASAIRAHAQVLLKVTESDEAKEIAEAAMQAAEEARALRAFLVRRPGDD